MFDLFRKKPKPISIEGLGDFRYFKDKFDEYWEADSTVDIRGDSIDVDFFAISGDRLGVNEQGKAHALDLAKDSEKIWLLIDHRFTALVENEIANCNVANVREHFYIKSIAIEDDTSWEVGFHCKTEDVFVEVFVRNGAVTNLEKDYGCCT